MLKTINQKDLTQLKKVESFLKETGRTIIDLSNEVSDIVGKSLNSTDIKIAITRAYALKLKEEDLEIVETILEILYIEDFIEKPLHIEEREKEDYASQKIIKENSETNIKREGGEDLHSPLDIEETFTVDDLLLDTIRNGENSLNENNQEYSNTKIEEEELILKKEEPIQINEDADKEINTGSETIEEELISDNIIQQKEISIEKNKNKAKNIWPSVFLGLLVAIVYIFFMDNSIDKEREKLIVVQEEEKQTLSKKVTQLEKDIGRSYTEISELKEKNSNLRKKINREIVSAATGQKIEKLSFDKTTKPQNQIKPSFETDGGESMDSNKIVNNGIEDVRKRLENYKREWERQELDKNKKIEELKEQVKNSIAQSETKALMDQKYDLYKTNKRFMHKKANYEVDEEQRKEFLTNCFDYYEDRKSLYQNYCLCMSNMVLKNKIDYLDMNTLLLKHKLKNSYPNMSYIGDGTMVELNMMEYEIEDVSKTCFNDFVKTRKQEEFKLNY